MEEKIRMRPQTARVLDDNFSELSSESPRSKLSLLINLPPSRFTNLEKIELKIDLEEIAFHKFGSHLPNLRELKLSNSNIDSIRSLGADWKSLQVLWVVQTGLQSIDGISAFPVIKELYCAFNLVKSLSALFLNETIQCLDVEGNQIEDFEEIEALQYCTSLFTLNLEGNPISKHSSYRDTVFKSINSLLLLDDLEKKSDIQAEASEELDIIMNSVRETSRVTKKTLENSRTKTEKNIFTDTSSTLTEGVFSGNPIKAMRFRRKKLLEGNNFMNLVREFKVQGNEEKKKRNLKDFILKPRKKDDLMDTQ